MFNLRGNCTLVLCLFKRGSATTKMGLKNYEYPESSKMLPAGMITDGGRRELPRTQDQRNRTKGSEEYDLMDFICMITVGVVSCSPKTLQKVSFQTLSRGPQIHYALCVRYLAPEGEPYRRG